MRVHKSGPLTPIKFFQGQQFLFAVLVLIVFSSCNRVEEKSLEDKPKKESVSNAVPVYEKPSVKKFAELNDQPGSVGVFEMPEMLTLCVHDSAKLEEMPGAFARAYAILDEELKTLKIKSNGAPGSIYFSSDPKNIIFECVYPIEKMPAKQPKKSMPVILESCYMHIYNYYGPYGELYLAYDDIRKKLKEAKLEQNGPMREFYITNPTQVKDSTRWLTRIMTPVAKKNSK